MQNYYIMNNDDTINRRIVFEFEVDDDIGINALVINYLSSAKTLIESIETFMKENIWRTLIVSLVNESAT